jgi:acyl-CoA thioesterase FadM
MTDTAVKALLTQPSTVTLTPGYEGANIGTIIGFKHVNYLVEKAIIEHFRGSGLPVGQLYERCGVGFDVVSLDTRIPNGLHVDDEVVITVDPSTRDGARELAFKVQMTVRRDGEERKAVSSRASVVLRRDDNEMRFTRSPEPLAGGLEQFVVGRIGGAAPGAEVAAVGPALVSGGSTDDDPVLDRLLAGRNAYGWKFRIPYPFVHFFERLQMSGYLRLVEEAKHRFVDARGISIGTLLARKNWIPAVSHSKVTLLDEALVEEDLYVVYTVDSIFKNVMYTAAVDFYVVRDGRLLPTATGAITHAYGIVENGNEPRLVHWDDEVARAFRGERDAS